MSALPRRVWFCVLRLPGTAVHLTNIFRARLSATFNTPQLRNGEELRSGPQSSRFQVALVMLAPRCPANLEEYPSFSLLVLGEGKANAKAGRWKGNWREVAWTMTLLNHIPVMIPAPTLGRSWVVLASSVAPGISISLRPVRSKL